jgi:hypothetical protein
MKGEPMLPTLKTRLVRSALAVVLVSSGPWAPGLEAQGPPGGGPPTGTPGPFPESLTVAVDCDAGDTIADALAQRADELRVEITGSCVEDVLIRRDRTTLVGVAAGAEIVGSPAPPVPGSVVAVTGATRVTLADLTIRDGRRGVSLHEGAAARLERLTIRDQIQDGVFLQGGSQAWVEDCSVVDNGGDGIAAWGSSSVILAFEATTVASRNGRVGVLVSGSSDVSGFQTSRLEADDNQFGLAAQLNGSFQGVGLVARGNDYGVWALLSGAISTGAEVRDSSVVGVYASDGGQVDIQGTVEDGGIWGVLGEYDATVAFRGTISGNPVGMTLDATEAWIANATVTDPVELSFGARVDFAGGNSFTGGVSCDGTVLVRGDVACPPAPSALTGAAERGSSRLGSATVSPGVREVFALEP